jgi:hypothetical protein
VHRRNCIGPCGRDLERDTVDRRRAADENRTRVISLEG